MLSHILGWFTYNFQTLPSPAHDNTCSSSSGVVMCFCFVFRNKKSQSYLYTGHSLLGFNGFMLKHFLETRFHRHRHWLSSSWLLHWDDGVENGTIWPQSQFYPQPHLFKMMRTRRKRINNRIGNKGDKKKVENGTTWPQFCPQPHFFKMMRGAKAKSQPIA